MAKASDAQDKVNTVPVEDANAKLHHFEVSHPPTASPAPPPAWSPENDAKSLREHGEGGL